MKYLKPIVLLLLVFIAGISIGVVGTRYVIRRDIRQAIRKPEFVRLRIERELTRELALDAIQRAKLDEILVNLQQEIAKARAERQPRIRPLLSDTQRRLNEILTPEQQLKFEKYQAEYGLFSLGGQGQNFPRLQKLRKLREENRTSPPQPPPPAPNAE